MKKYDIATINTTPKHLPEKLQEKRELEFKTEACLLQLHIQFLRTIFSKNKLLLSVKNVCALTFSLAEVSLSYKHLSAKIMFSNSKKEYFTD